METPFKPKTTQYPSLERIEFSPAQNTDRFERLYLDSARRLQRQSTANIDIKRLRTPSPCKDNSVHEKLYRLHSERDLKLAKLKEKVEREEGVTFKPNIKHYK